jgi:hypothetical protein
MNTITSALKTNRATLAILLVLNVLAACQPAKMRSVVDRQGAGDDLTVDGIKSLEVSPKTASLPVGMSQAYTVRGFDADKSNSIELTTIAKWSVVDEDIADNSGERSGDFTAKKKGTTKVTATVNELTADATLEVIAPAVLSIDVLPRDSMLTVGGKQQLIAVANYSNDSSKDVTSEATWSSANGSIVGVNDDLAKGMITGLKIGSTEVSVELGQIGGSATVSVVAAKLVSLEISPLNPAIPKGTLAQFQAIGVYNNGDRVDMTAQVVWQAADIRIAQLSVALGNFGKFLGVGIGSTQITAIMGSISASTSLTVTDAQLVSVEVVPASKSIPLGAGFRFVAMAHFTDGAVSDVTQLSSWSSAKTSVATVNNDNDKGYATSKALGEADIIALHRGIQGVGKLIVTKPSVPVVTIKADGVANALSVATGKSVDVEWTSSESATTCRVTLNGASFDTRLNATAKYKVLSQAVFSVVCSNAAGGTSAPATVTISVTLPQVALTTNGSTTDITVNKNASVPLVWSSTNASTCSLRKNGAELSQAKSGSQNSNIAVSSVFELICKDAELNSASKVINVFVTQSVNLLVDAGNPEVLPPVTSRPISIFFALDITGSMQPNITVIKNNIKTFVEQLKERNFMPRIGIMPFRDNVPGTGGQNDTPEPRFALSEDIEAVKNYLGTLNAGGGYDSQEAALLAIEESLSELMAKETRPDALKVVFVITDNVSHRGPGSLMYVRDCSLTTTISRFKSLSVEQQKLVKVFFSAPGEKKETCSGFTSPEQQFIALQSQILTALTQENRGGQVPWPFTVDGLTVKFTELLTFTSPAVDMVCLNKTADLFINGSLKTSWAAAGLSSVYSSYNANTKLAINKTFLDSDLAALNANKGKLTMNRCCVSKSAAMNGNFNSCLKNNKIESLPFTLQVN